MKIIVYISLVILSNSSIWFVLFILAHFYNKVSLGKKSTNVNYKETMFLSCAPAIFSQDYSSEVFLK